MGIVSKSFAVNRNTLATNPIRQILLDTNQVRCKPSTFGQTDIMQPDFQNIFVYSYKIEKIMKILRYEFCRPI